MARTKWTKKRHSLVFAVLRVIFRPFSKLRYNYTAKKSKIKGPCVIMCNHATTMDPFFVSLSFKAPVYFFASDDIFNIKVASPIIRYLVAPIPKSKSMSDLQAVRDCLTVLKEGGVVGLFPEGNRTLSGGQWEMTDAAAKLVKLSKAPLVLYNIEGGYGTDPRWGTKIRKGKMTGYVKRVISPEEYKNMSVDELYQIICDELNVSYNVVGAKFKSRKRAENIERVLYMCPKCNAVSSIVSKGKRFSCRKCGEQWEYGEDLSITPKDPFDSVYYWHEWERSVLTENIKNNEVSFSDFDVKFFESVRLKRKKKLLGDRIFADAKGLRVFADGDVSEFFPFSEMDGFTAVGKRKFNFYYQGKTLQIKGEKKFCALKYLHLYEGVQNV